MKRKITSAKHDKNNTEIVRKIIGTIKITCKRAMKSKCK